MILSRAPSVRLCGLAAISLGASLAPIAARASAQLPIPIKHIVIIMQENRSFDSYFGTYPGAEGIPPGTCVPLDPRHPEQGCVKPFHDQNDSNSGGPHWPRAAQADLDDGIHSASNDGFVAQQLGGLDGHSCTTKPDRPKCAASRAGVLRHDVMGYHTASEIPNYWAYAQNFVLQDHMFESVRSWSLPAHLYLTSEWSAVCANQANAATCTTDPELLKAKTKTEYPWVSLFQLLDLHGVSWKYYLGEGPEPDCSDGDMVCDPPGQTTTVPSIWNPVPNFAYVRKQNSHYLEQHVTAAASFLKDVAHGNLPQVSWIVPSQDDSEHPPASITAGMEYVTSLVNAIMASPNWQDTAIFITWDDWGGFYDHAAPPLVDYNKTKSPVQGYGLRVPGLMVSAYARTGMIDHAYYSFDAYARLMEDWFAGGARLDPVALKNPDARPTIRDNLTSVTLIGGSSVALGDLATEFDFTAAPRKPLILSNAIPSEITADCDVSTKEICRSSTVLLSWTRAPRSFHIREFSYVVQRDGVDLLTCRGDATHCTDVPGPGTHFYRVYSVDTQKIASPVSAAVQITQP